MLRLPKESGLKIPHIGWNSLSVGKPGGLFAGVEEEPYVYFVHSYYLRAEEDVVTATAEYGTTIHAAGAEGEPAGLPVPPGEERPGGAFAAGKLQSHGGKGV